MKTCEIDFFGKQITLPVIFDCYDDETITNNQKEQIINVLIKVKNSGALKDKNFQQQASQLTDQIQSGAKNIFSKFNTPETRNWFQKLIDSIVSWFRGIFGGAIILN